MLTFPRYNPLSFVRVLEECNAAASARRHRLRFAQKTPDMALHGDFIPTHDKVEDPIGRTIKDAIQASCTIFVLADSGQWEGSGFHLGDGLIATAGHVVPAELARQNHQIAVTFDGKQMFEAQFVISEQTIDSGIVHCPEAAAAAPAVRLADSDTAQVGDIIAVVGSPQGFHDTATVGRIANIHQTINDPSQPAWNDFIIITADIAQGASGGMCMTGDNANIGIGQRVICPANKIRMLLSRVAGGG
jgi:S1-C subfamily serine protease